MNPEDHLDVKNPHSKVIDCFVRNDLSSGSKLTSSTCESANKQMNSGGCPSIYDELKNPVVIDIDDEDGEEFRFNNHTALL